MRKWIDVMAGRRVLIVGDVILDEYLTGKTTRLSREAPIPVLEFESRRLIAGGAANPAANIAALGGRASLLAVIGADAEAEALRGVLRTSGIDSGALIVDSARPTTVKTRIMAHMGLRFPQQVARIDRLSRAPIDPLIEGKAIARAVNVLGSVDAILCSDYGGGLLTIGLIEALRDAARAAGVLLTADAQGALDKYRGFEVVKCNADDAAAFLRRDLITDDDFAAAAAELCGMLGLARAMVITRGADGATLAEIRTNGAVTTAHIPATAITDVYDTVGAGDTAIAVLTLAISAGVEVSAAVSLANAASGIVVRRVGNYAPSPEELTAAIGAKED